MTRVAMAAPVLAGRSPLGLGLAYSAFAALGLIWGTNFIFVKWEAAAINPAQIVLLRVLFGFLPLLVFALVTGALRWRDWRPAHHFLVMSLLATAFYYVALQGHRAAPVERRGHAERCPPALHLRHRLAVPAGGAAERAFGGRSCSASSAWS